jgi:hypothetical protein
MGIHPSKHKLITFLNIETFQNKILSSAYKLSMSFLAHSPSLTSKQKKSSYLQRTTQSSPNLNTTQSSCTADHKQNHAHNLQPNKQLQKQKHTTPPSTSTAGSFIVLAFSSRQLMLQHHPFRFTSRVFHRSTLYNK